MIIKNDTVYDYIVYGATIPGIVFAVSKARQNNSVLLLNHYGFAGGSITESLSCRQVVNPKWLSKITRQIFDGLLLEKNGVLPVAKNEFMVDPEAVKKVLQNRLDSEKIELLYHITAAQISRQRDDLVHIDLLAKEGLVTVTGKTVLDTTDDQYLSSLRYNVPGRRIRQRLNLIILSEQSISFGAFKPKALTKIGKNRYWISIDLPETHEFEMGNVLQKAIDEISEILQACNGRIQVLPICADALNYPDSQGREQSEHILRLPELIKSLSIEYCVFANASSLELYA